MLVRIFMVTTVTGFLGFMGVDALRAGVTATAERSCRQSLALPVTLTPERAEYCRQLLGE